MFFINLSKKATKALEEVSGGVPLKQFIKDQVIEMAIAKPFNESVIIAQTKIDQIKEELKAKKEELKKEIE